MHNLKPFDISAKLGICDRPERTLVWAPSKEEAIAKFQKENPRWKLQTVREAIEIDPASYVG